MLKRQAHNRRPLRKIFPLLPQSREALAWCAGFFDGEGHISLKPDNSIIVGIGQTSNRNDSAPDTLIRFALATRLLGGISGPRYVTKSTRPLFYWQVQNFEDAQAVIAMIWEWLSKSKRQKAIEVLRKCH